jgi:hypothetical protein
MSANRSACSIVSHDLLRNVDVNDLIFHVVMRPFVTARRLGKWSKTFAHGMFRQLFIENLEIPFFANPSFHLEDSL